MKNHEPRPNLTEKDLEKALHAYAQNPAVHMPESDEEIIAFFKSLDLSDVPAPNVSKFKKALTASSADQRPAGMGGILKNMLVKCAAKAQPSEAPALRPMFARKGKKMTVEEQKKIDEVKNANRKKGKLP